jgi:hypothetical protein
MSVNYLSSSKKTVRVNGIPVKNIKNPQGKRVTGHLITPSLNKSKNKTVRVKGIPVKNPQGKRVTGRLITSNKEGKSKKKKKSKKRKSKGKNKKYS